MRPSAALSLLPVLAILACGDRAGDPSEDADRPARPASAASAPDTLNAALIARGRGVYDAVCAECHAIEPPPLTAPTLREIVDRYHEAYLDPAEALDHLADYIREPAPSKSQLPQVMIDEWGVMPPQPLPPDDLAAVAWFIWNLPPDTTLSQS